MAKQKIPSNIPTLKQIQAAIASIKNIKRPKKGQPDADLIKQIQIMQDINILTPYLVDPNNLVRKQAKLRYKVLTNADPEVVIFEEKQKYDPQDFITAFNKLTQGK